ncbi:MAG: membrane protein insertion efficiency factor YidD [Candidatus Dojkabacteria bacterium]
MKYLLLLFIKMYQILFSFDHGIPSKLFPHVRICIYHPSCSAYGYESIKRYGSIIGGYLSIHRVLRCGPWSEGGLDPVKDINLKGWKKIITYI